MSSFLVRVELHGASYPTQYITLHTNMEKAGFSRTITAGDGKVYPLPTAEYVVSGNYTLEQVFKAAKGAADKTVYKSTVLAVLFTAWRGF